MRRFSQAPDRKTIKYSSLKPKFQTYHDDDINLLGGIFLTVGFISGACFGGCAVKIINSCSKENKHVESSQ